MIPNIPTSYHHHPTPRCSNPPNLPTNRPTDLPTDRPADPQIMPCPSSASSNVLGALPRRLWPSGMRWATDPVPWCPCRSTHRCAGPKRRRPTANPPLTRPGLGPSFAKFHVSTAIHSPKNAEEDEKFHLRKNASGVVQMMICWFI